MQQPTGMRAKKSYEIPTLKKLPPEEAKKVLLDHARKGNPGAKDILELVLSMRK